MEDTGAAFGELAFLYDAPQAVAVKVVTDCMLYHVDQNTLIATVEHLHKNWFCNEECWGGYGNRMHSGRVLSKSNPYGGPISERLSKEESLSLRLCIRKP
jgi:hypothetical protein